MKIPYLGEGNSLKEAPLFFRAFAERLEKQGLTKEDAVDVAYQGYRALLLYPENVQAETLALSVFPDSKEKQNALIALTKAFLASPPYSSSRCSKMERTFVSITLSTLKLGSMGLRIV